MGWWIWRGRLMAKRGIVWVRVVSAIAELDILLPFFAVMSLGALDLTL
jgi:hypothetical protein